MQTVYDFLQKCEVFYLATVEDNRPKVRPFGATVIFEGRIYLMTGKVKAVSEQMGKNPHIELSAYDKETGTWVRVRGEAVEDDRREARVCMLEAYPFMRSTYNEDDGNMQVLYIKNAEAVFETFGGEKRTVNF